MKKVLVLSPKSIYDVNGTSNYAYKLILILLKKNYHVDTFFYFNSEHLIQDRFINNTNLHFLNDILLSIADKEIIYESNINDDYSEKDIKRNVQEINELNNHLIPLIKLNNYDIILDCTHFLNKSIMQMNNYYFIQQFEYKWYNQDKFINNGLINPFTYAKNLVLYDKYQLKTYGKNQNYFFNPLSSYNKNFILQNAKNVLKNIDKKYHGDIVYIGRINNLQKNISLINEMNEKYNANVQEYGPIESDTKVTNYHGKLSRTEVMNVLNSAKFCIIVSNTEGFSYSLVEAISLGVPVIIRNTYPSAEFLTSYKNGFLINKNLDAKKFAQELNKISKIDINEYGILVKNCIDFATKELSTDEFEKRWLEIIN